METLILKSDRGSFEKFYIKHMQKKNVETMPYFKNMGKVLRYLLVLYVQKLKLPYASFWYGKWKKKIKQYKNVILFDRNYNWNIVKYIHKKNPECRIIVWYWNPLSVIERVPKKYRAFCEEWSFDQGDCKKYGLNYNVQFSFKDIFECRAIENIDLYFVGYDKERVGLLLKLKNYFVSCGKRVKFVVVKDKTSKKIEEFKYSSPISYEENLNNLFNSKAIVELVQKGQEGLTVRCIEALFLGKKVITNNKKIKYYDFYNKNNIYILENNDYKEKELYKFISLPYEAVDKTIINQYDFNYWLKKFNI